jgi:hypothetical protein
MWSLESYDALDSLSKELGGGFRLSSEKRDDRFRNARSRI